MSNLISKTEAIEKVKALEQRTYTPEEFLELLESLPLQPDAVICKNCRYWKESIDRFRKEQY